MLSLLRELQPVQLLPTPLPSQLVDLLPHPIKSATAQLNDELMRVENLWCM
jgi:hypothetical protein